MSDSLVLCSPTARLPRAWLPECACVSLTEAELWRELAALDPIWLPRSQAETDPSFKQWIPYVLLRNPHGELAAYPRQGSETRLHGRWSVGIGGHINPVDDQPAVERTAHWWRDCLWNGLHRELLEEFPGAVEGRTRFLGLIHESFSSVGRVHLGAAFLHDVGDLVTEPGPELAGLQWLPLAKIGGHEWPFELFETWSRLALKLSSK